MVHLPAWLALSIHIFLIPAGCPKVNNALDRESEGKTVILGNGDVLLSILSESAAWLFVSPTSDLLVSMIIESAGQVSY